MKRWLVYHTTHYGQDDGALLGVEAETAEEARVKAGDGKTVRVIRVEEYTGAKK